MNLEAVRDLFNALYRDFKKLSSSDPDYDRRYRYMLITNYLGHILDILNGLNPKTEVKVKGKEVRDGYRIIIHLDPLWYEKLKRIAYARGFIDPDHLIDSYLKEWIENDLIYIEE